MEAVMQSTEPEELPMARAMSSQGIPAYPISPALASASFVTAMHGPSGTSAPKAPAMDAQPVIEIPKPRYSNLPYATGRSGLVYDIRMRYHLDPTEGEEAHPERPRRIAEIYHALIEAGLAVDPKQQNPDDDPANQYKLARIAIRQALPEEICLVHAPEHVAFVQSLYDLPKDRLAELTRQGDSIYYHNLSWLCASLAAGGAIEAAKAVVMGAVKNAIAVIRPPGHHAEHGAASGFCFFNNVGVAARVIQQQFPDTIKKILIMDWDVHHGNGVQQAFEADPSVLYISTHVYKNAGFYPYTTYGNHEHCGIGPGLGKNVNIPWGEQGMTDADYMLAFQRVVMPIATEFDPDLVFISAGFDAAEGDELGACHVSPAGFAHMTHMLMQLAGGKVVSCLEGGYNLQSIAKSAVAMTKVMMGEAPPRLGELTPTPSAVSTILRVERTQGQFWKCMYPKNTHRPLDEIPANSQRAHDILRDWQSNRLKERFDMHELFIRHDQTSSSYANQALVTPDFNDKKPLLIIFHDPPEAHAYPDLRTNRLELHNTILTDGSIAYVEWAIGQGFAVMDINVPRHVTDIHDVADYQETDAETIRAASAKEVALFIWDNYIRSSSNTNVFLIGIGDAYSAILELLSTQETALQDVDLTVCFVAGNHALRSIQSPSSDDDAARVFHASSLVYVAPTHAAFAPDRIKKLKRRYGNVVKSTPSDLQGMLASHFAEVCDKLLDLTHDWRVSARDGEADGDGDGMVKTTDQEMLDAPAVATTNGYHP